MAKQKQIFTAPWYPWYVDDVLTSESVDHLTLAEEGAYRRLLDKAWKNGSVPADPRRCANVIGKGCTPKIAEAVLSMFQPVQGDPTRVINSKLEKVRKEQEKKYKTKSRVGKENVAKRWKKRASGDSNGIATDKHSESDLDLDLDLNLQRLIDACVREHSDKDARVVEIAVLETMIRRIGSANENKPIKSIRYFDQEIAQAFSPKGFVSLGDNVIDGLLAKRRLDVKKHLGRD